MAYAPVVPYADLDWANGYMSDRLETDTWDEADNDTRNKALRMATRYIDTLPFVGSKTDPDQVREFPREDEDEIPDEVKNACAEAALALLEGKTLDAMIEQATASSESTGDASVSRRNGGTLGMNDGVISPMVLRLLAPWLENPDFFKFERAN